MKFPRNVTDISSVNGDYFDHPVFFIARQHNDARYLYSKSVCTSVRPSPQSADLKITTLFNVK